MTRDTPGPAPAGQAGAAGAGEGGAAGANEAGGSGGAPDEGPSEAELAALAATAKTVLGEHCSTQCHDADSRGGGGEAKSTFGSVMLVDRMIAEKRIVPGEPEESKLWTKIASGSMPTGGQTFITEEEKAAIKEWIAAGAPDWRDYEDSDSDDDNHL